MSQHLVNKKKNILQHLNVHLQVQAIKLGHVDRDTNILPNSFSNKNDSKAIKTLKHPLNQTWHKTEEIAVINKTIVNKNNVQKTKIRKLRPYDPLYTWNRGGRLKELRIRCQARKFLYLWMTKSLGRVTETNAAKFYRTQLIKKCWIIWYDQYWQLSIEPRLLGRAILHRKAIVMRSTFLAWQWWTKLRAIGRDKTENSLRYRDRHLKKSVVTLWLSWIFVRKCKMKLTLISDDWRKNNLLLRFLNIWKIQLITQRETNAKMTIAVRHDTVIILSKVFQHWIEVGPDLKREKIGLQKAISYHQHIQLKKFLDNWVRYHHGFKLKQKEHDKWRDHYNWNLAHRYLKTWREQYRRSLTMSVVDIRITDLRRRFQLRRIFEAWRCHIDLRTDKNKVISRATSFYDLSLKKRMWSGMIRNCVVARQKSDMRIRGREFNDRITLQMYFNKWSNMLDYKDDQIRRVELGAARAHYRRATFIKCFRHFSQFIAQSNVIKERKTIADTFRREKVLKRSIAGWLRYVAVVKRKKETLQIKNEYLKDRVISLVWTLWFKRTTERLTAKTKFVEFVNHKIINDKSKLLNVWRSKANELTRGKNCADKAIMYYRGRLLLKCVDAMKRFVQQEEETRCLDKIARDHFRQQLMKKAFYGLHTYSRIKRQNLTAILNHISIKNYKTRRVIFNRWRTFIDERRSIYDVVDNLFQRKMFEVIQSRFVQWQRMIRIQKTKRQNSVRLVAAAKTKLDTRRQLRILQFWRQGALERSGRANKCVVASDFCRLNLAKKCFDAWRHYREQQKMNAVKREQASWFWQKSQLTVTWVVWTKALGDRQREDYYTKYALGHWASKLQERVFREWLQYKIDRKHKHENEKEAFALFQRRAKRYTICQWLRSGDFLIQWRQSQRGAANNGSTFLSRAFEHWRQWTATRAAKTRVISVISAEPSIEIKRPKIQSIEPKTHRNVKARPAPKIPDFLLKPLDRVDHSQRKSYNDCGSRNQPIIPLPGNIYGDSCQTEFSDDVLLPPASFSVSLTTGNRGRQCKDGNIKSCMEELGTIKERLQRFKDTKESLRKLREEVREYDRVLSHLIIEDDSSFCEEFNPLGCRAELVSHITQMEAYLEEELPICNQLTERARTLVNMCKIGSD